MATNLIGVQKPFRAISQKDFRIFYLVSVFHSKLVYLSFIPFCVEQKILELMVFARQQYLIWLQALSRATTKKILQLF